MASLSDRMGDLLVGYKRPFGVHRTVNRRNDLNGGSWRRRHRKRRYPPRAASSVWIRFILTGRFVPSD